MLTSVALCLALAAPVLTGDSLSFGRGAVLVLFAEDPAQYATQSIENGVNAVMAAAGPSAPSLYYEYLDATRFGGTADRDAVGRFLTDKYRDRRLDLIVAVGQGAIEFLARSRAPQWSRVPILFAATHVMTIDGARTLPDAAGLVFAYPFADALPTIEAALPGLRHIALVSGTSAVERARASDVPAAIARAGFDLIDLAGLTLSDTLNRVRALPDDTAVVIAGPIRDGSGRTTAPNTLVPLIAAASNRPAFMVGAPEFLGSGIVGGRFRDFTKIGQRIGTRVLGLLRDFRADVEVVPAGDFTTVAFDARQLQRWRIDRRRLPAGSTVSFQQPSLWRDYRLEILGALAALGIQFVLIAGLLYERRARGRAERDSRRYLSIAAMADRRTAMTALTGSIAHELNQPLSAILHNTAAAEKLVATNRATPEELADILGDIRREDTRATQIIQRHRTMLKTHEVDRRALDLYATVREALALVAHDAEGRQVRFDVRLPASATCTVAGDAVMLQQVFVNLVMNAMDAMAETPVGRRRVVIGTAAGVDRVEVFVQDAGPGLPAELDGRLFEPFVTTKPTGLGIGLSVVRSIIEAHAGRVDARNSPDGGAEFRITLPRMFSA